MPLEVYSRTMRRAADLAGGADKLAEALHANERDVKSWISGARVPPLAAFFAASALIRTLSGGSSGRN